MLHASGGDRRHPGVTAPPAPADRPERPRRGARSGALAATLAAVALLASVAVGQRLWEDLRASVVRLDLSLASARARQQEMAERIGQAQAALQAEQARLRTLEERLRAREATLQAERLIREIALAIAGLDASGGIEAASRALERTAHGSAERGAVLDSALTQARQALAAVRAQDPGQLAQRLETLALQAARLAPGRSRWPPAPRGFESTDRIAAALHGARFALERGDASGLRRSLATAMAWLDACCDPTAPDATALRAGIATLLGRSPQPDLSTLRAALVRVQEALASAAGKLGEGSSGISGSTGDGGPVGDGALGGS